MRERVCWVWYVNPTVNAKTAIEVKPMKRRRRERRALGGCVEAEGLGAISTGLVPLAESVQAVYNVYNLPVE